MANDRDEDTYIKVWLGEWKDKVDVGPQVASIDVEDRDVGTDIATLILDDTGGVNSIGIPRGQKVHIVMGWATEFAYLFVGRVMEPQFLSGNRGKVKVVCFDESVRMSKAPKETGRKHAGTLKAVLETIIKPYGILLGKIEIDPMPEWKEENPILQRSRSDWTLIQQLAKAYNSRAFIEPNAVEGEPPKEDKEPGKPQLYFIHQDVLWRQKPSGRLTFCHGFSDLQSFDFRDVGRTASPSTSGTIIDPRTGKVCKEKGPEPAKSDPSVPSDNQIKRAEQTDGPLSHGDLAKRAQHAASAEIKPDELHPRANLTGLASNCEKMREKIKPDLTRQLGYHGQGIANGSVKIRAKDTVDIDGLPANASGTWYLKRVNHILVRTRIENKVHGTYTTKIVATR